MEASREIHGLVAVIDVGSHAARLVVAEASADAGYRILESLWTPVSLGNDIFARGVVRHASMATLITILQQYREVLASWKIDEVLAVGSSSLGEATNAETCIERIASATGIRLQILEPADEALAVFRVFAERAPTRREYASGSSWILMARSGTTQSIVFQDGKVVFFGSHNDGALRFSRNFDLPEAALQRVLPFVVTQSVKSIKSSCGIGKIDRFITFHDDICDLLDRVLPLASPAEGRTLTSDEFSAISTRVLGMSSEDMRDWWGLPEAPIVTTRISLLVIGILLAESGASTIHFPRIPLTTAIVDALISREGCFPDSLRSGFDEQILSATHALGRKFQYDETHAMETARVAGMLFDQLSGTFQPRERILVQVAAILHDIGMFISAKGHHRHSAELVAASDILGLSRKELQEIAWTVRFHRKGLPGGTAVEYRAMDRPARLSIFRMAAIIRLADALSEPGLPRVERLVLDFSETVCTMQVELAGRQYEYLEIMRILLENKKSYFENYYGTDLALERFRLVEGV